MANPNLFFLVQSILDAKWLIGVDKKRYRILAVFIAMSAGALSTGAAPVGMFASSRAYGSCGDYLQHWNVAGYRIDSVAQRLESQPSEHESFLARSMASVRTGLTDTGLTDTGLIDTGLIDTGLIGFELIDTGPRPHCNGPGCAPDEAPQTSSELPLSITRVNLSEFLVQTRSPRLAATAPRATLRCGDEVQCSRQCEESVFRPPR